MTAAAEPRPAELPLSGGREGALVRLHPLLTGQMRRPRAWFLREEGRLAWRRALGFGIKREDWISVPVLAYLIEHPGAGLTLIDTGFHPSVAVNPRENLGRLWRIASKDLEMKPDQAVAAQLRLRGLQPGQVGAVLMTHLHPDHASAVSEFPDATFLVSRAEWEAATSRSRFHGYAPRQFDHAFDYRLLDFEGPAAESFSGFARSVDVFGDGSVRAVYTPGHTLGHTSVVVRTARGELLVAGDAMYLRRTLDESRPPHRTEDDHLFRRSLREISQYARETPGARIIPGHDWDDWQRLPGAF